MPAHLFSRAGVGAPYQGDDPAKIQLCQSYQPGFVVLSVLIAIVGSASTIELLLRRTANRGAWNIGLLIGAGISFGAVSTFAMHYIGNNSITLLLPASEIQLYGIHRIRLSYSPGYTVLSLVVSVVSMCAAFAVNGLDVEGLLTEWRETRKKKKKQHLPFTSEMAQTAQAPRVDQLGKEQNENSTIRSGVFSQSTSMKPTLHHSPSSLSQPPPSPLVSSSSSSSSVHPSHTLGEPFPSNEYPTSNPTNTPGTIIDNNDNNNNNSSKVDENDSPLSRSPVQTRNPYSSYLSVTSIPLSGRRMSFEEFADSAVGGGMLNRIPSQDVIPVLSNLQLGKYNRGIFSAPFEEEKGMGFKPISEEKPSDVEEEIMKDGNQVRIRSVEASWSEPHKPLSKKQGDDDGSEISEPDQKLEHDHGQKERIDHGYHSTEWTKHIDLSKRSRSSIGGSTTDSTIDQEISTKGRSKIVNWWIRELGLRDVTRFEVWKVVIAGTICGFGVAGMHYLGQKSINSIPYVAYSPFLVVLSVLIACGAVTVGLWVLFLVLRPKLKHSLLKRLATSCILGGATSLMHWTAVLGTSYAVNANLVDIPSKTTQGTARRLISGLVAGLAVVACVVTVASVSLAHRRMIAHKARRRGVVLAAAIFDEKGHVLVTPDGVLPLYSLGNLDQLQTVHQHPNAHKRSSWKSHMPHRFSGTRFDEESLDSSSVQDFDLTNSHPAFVASLRSTWSWKQPGSYPTLSSSHNSSNNNNKASSRRQSTMSLDIEGDNSSTGRSILEESGDATSFVSAFSPNIARSFGSMSSATPRPLKTSARRFVSKFTEAAATLAVELTGSAKNARMLGVLYDRIFTTGFVSFSSTPETHEPSGAVNTVSRGQLLLLAGRCENHTDRALYNRRGYTFVESSAMCRIMSTVLSVPLADMLPFVQSMEVFTRPKPTVPKAQGRVYVGALAVQPLPFEGLKILLGEADRTNIPMKEFGMTLADGSIASSQASTHKDTKRSHLALSINELGEAIAKMDGSTLEQMLREASSSFNNTEPDQLQIVLIDSILSMLRRLPQDVLKILIKSFVICPSIVTLSPPSSITNTTTTTGGFVHVQGKEPSYLVVFRAILPPTIDVSSVGGSFTWEPFRLFRAKNECVLQEARLSAGGHAHTLGVGLDDPRLGRQAPSRRPSKVQWGEIRSPQSPISANDTTSVNGHRWTKNQTQTQPGSMFSESFSLCPAATATPITPVTAYRPPHILVRLPTGDPTEGEGGETDVKDGLDRSSENEDEKEKERESEVRAYSDTWLSQLLLVRGVNV